MVKSEYYRRQADLCLQLARVQHDQKAAIRLIEFAEGLITKAEAAVPFNAGPSDHRPASARMHAVSANL